MELRKIILYFVLAMLGVVLWHKWQDDYPSQNVVSAAAVAAVHPADYTPDAYTKNESKEKTAGAATVPAETVAQNKMISVKTDLLDVKINLQGGNVVSAKLLQYPVSLQEKNTPIHLLNANEDTLYVAQSGLTVPNDPAAGRVTYQTSQASYALPDGQNILTVTLNGKTSDGLTVQKTFTFVRGNYAIKSGIVLTNHSGKTWNGNIYNQITRRFIPVGGSFYSRSYSGGAVSTEDAPYKKLTFESMSENNFSRDIHGGWLAMQQQYFLGAWIPPRNQTYHYYSRSFGDGHDGENNVFILGYMTQPIQLANNATLSFDSKLYVGPEIAKNLEALAKGLGLTIDYGILSPISQFLFWLMSEIHHYVGNWGWSIILVTIVVKIAFYGLSKKSYASMAKTRDVQPKIKALQMRYGDDKQAMSKAMMELYRKEKINPLGGCFPMLVQIPVFFALYYVLIESVQLRQAPFIFWIQDLSVRDPYFILPVLMGLSMLLQQKLSPPPPDPTQAKMMMFLPVIMTVFFATFPSGLVLYWITNNCASILQQWYVMRGHVAKNSGAKKHLKK
jgi:YidC/Oxa1 family membrane protein insertase